MPIESLLACSGCSPTQAGAPHFLKNHAFKSHISKVAWGFSRLQSQARGCSGILELL